MTHEERYRATHIRPPKAGWRPRISGGNAHDRRRLLRWVVRKAKATVYSSGLFNAICKDTYGPALESTVPEFSVLSRSLRKRA